MVVVTFRFLSNVWTYRNQSGCFMMVVKLKFLLHSSPDQLVLRLFRVTGLYDDTYSL